MEGKSVSDDNIDSNKKENDATQTLNDQKNDGTEIVVESSTHSTDGSSNKTVAEEPATDVKGWLQKRTKGLLGMSYKWERQWFQLKGTELLYGENEQVGIQLFALGCFIIVNHKCNRQKQTKLNLKPINSK